MFENTTQDQAENSKNKQSDVVETTSSRGRLIGLTGLKGSGKDAAAQSLIISGWQNIAFADALRGVLMATRGFYVSVPLRHRGWKLWRTHEPYYKVVERLSNDVAKRVIPDVRRVQQTLGTEGVRSHIWDTVWVDAAARKIEAWLVAGKDVVITDVRFPNEADLILGLGGELVRVDRPGVSVGDQHASESQVLSLPATSILRNTGTLEDLAITMSSIATGVVPGGPSGGSVLGRRG